jgi:hypothetical protein
MTSGNMHEDLAGRPDMTCKSLCLPARVQLQLTMDCCCSRSASCCRCACCMSQGKRWQLAASPRLPQVLFELVTQLITYSAPSPLPADSPPSCVASPLLLPLLQVRPETPAAVAGQVHSRQAGSTRQAAGAHACPVRDYINRDMSLPTSRQAGKQAG